MIVRFLVCLVVASTLMLSGCGYNVTPLTKYDKKSANLQKNAVVVIGAKNFSFFDLAKYSGPASVNVKKSPPKPAATKTQQSKQSVSADPNNQSYQGDRYDLTRLYKKKEPDCENTPAQDCEQKSEPQPTTKSTPAAQEYRIHKQSTVFSLYSYNKCAYLIEPGIYYIAFAFIDPNVDSNPNADTEFTRMPGVNQNGVVQYGAFEVEAGQVVYLGDLNFNWVDQYDKDFIRVDGDINQVRQDLVAGDNKQIAYKLVQGQFFPVGSKIVASEQGNSYKLISN